MNVKIENEKENDINTKPLNNDTDINMTINVGSFVVGSLIDDKENSFSFSHYCRQGTISFDQVEESSLARRESELGRIIIPNPKQCSKALLEKCANKTGSVSHSHDSTDSTSTPKFNTPINSYSSFNPNRSSGSSFTLHFQSHFPNVTESTETIDMSSDFHKIKARETGSLLIKKTQSYDFSLI